MNGNAGRHEKNGGNNFIKVYKIAQSCMTIFVNIIRICGGLHIIGLQSLIILLRGFHMVHTLLFVLLTDLHSFLILSYKNSSMHGHNDVLCI